jgi:hypothetical protein
MYVSPISSKRFEEKFEYQDHLNAIMWETVYNSANPIPWRVYRPLVREFQANRDFVQSITNHDMIFDWFAKNGHAVSRSPLNFDRLLKNYAPYTRLGLIGSRTWLEAHVYTFAEASHEEEFCESVEGGAWTFEIEVHYDANIRPKFHAGALWQSFNSFGWYVVDYFFQGVRGGEGTYLVKIAQPGKVWRKLAVLEKLKGNISGDILAYQLQES